MKLLTIKMTAVSTFDLQYNENWSTPTLPKGFGGFGAGYINYSQHQVSNAGCQN